MSPEKQTVHAGTAYSEEDYFDFINFLLRRMNLQQLRYVLDNINQFFCGGYFEQPPAYMKEGK